MSEEQQANNVTHTNQSYVLDSSFMMMRVNTQPLILDIKNFMASREVAVKKTDEGWQEETISIGRPYANEEGIMKICNIVRMNINQHTAQGNLDKDHYWALIERARQEITDTIILKCYDWDIDDNDLNTVINEICRLMEVFFTRPIDDKERSSYGQQIRSHESLQTAQTGGMLGRFTSGVGNR